MAKRKAVEQSEPEAAKTRPVRLDLPPDAHRLLRLVAADADVSMASYARDVLMRHLVAEAKVKGIK